MAMVKIAYRAWQVIWGLPQTAVGAAVFAAHRSDPHFGFHGAVVTIWQSRYALSLGPFVFLGRQAGCDAAASGEEAVEEGLLVHEYGHTIQSLILGPLYLLVIGLPSIIWLRTPALSRKRRHDGTSYYAFYTERWANYLGERVLKRQSAGQALID